MSSGGRYPLRTLRQGRTEAVRRDPPAPGKHRRSKRKRSVGPETARAVPEVACDAEVALRRPRRRRTVSPDETAKEGPPSAAKTARARPAKAARGVKKEAPAQAVTAAGPKDVLAAPEYADDILEAWKGQEVRKHVKPYMSKQRDITPRMRAILVDWLVEVHLRFKLSPSTLFIAVRIVDGYCESVPVARSRLQLVGVTALLIACKYEETSPPEVRDCVYITDNAYTAEEVLEMELGILTRLQFRVTFPTAFDFLAYFTRTANLDESDTSLAHYLVERMLQEHDMLEHLPSKIAAAGVFLASLKHSAARGRDAWPEEMVEITGSARGDLLECAKQMLAYAAAGPGTLKRPIESVKNKYQAEERHEVARLSLPRLPKH